MQCEIEDRTNRKPPAMGAGMFVVWKLVTKPFPSQLYRGEYATRSEAEKRVAELTAAATPAGATTNG